jgi:Zn-dependent protease with chaperone function
MHHNKLVQVVALFIVVFAASSMLAVLAQQVTVPIPTEEARLHSVLVYFSYFWNFFFSVVVLFLFASTGLSAKLRDFIEKRTSKKWLQCILYLIAFILLLHVAFIPQSYVVGFFMPHYFKLSDQSFMTWFVDYIKAALIGADAFVETYALLFLLIRKVPKQWPVLICLYYIVLIGVNLFAYPSVFAPLFNTYRPMQDCALRTKIETLAEKAKLDRNVPIVIQNASKQTNSANARVEGFGPSMRIVVWDTTLKSMPDDEIIGILAHEMGHYRLHHIYWDFLFTVLISVTFVPINMLYARRMVKMLPAKWNIRDLGDWAITPVLILVTTIFSFVFLPISNSFSRLNEHQADEFALNITGNGPTYAKAMIDLGSLGLSDPNVHPFIEFWFFTHPSISKRVEEANRYTREHQPPSAN